MPRAADAPAVKIPAIRTREGLCTVVHHQETTKGGNGHTRLVRTAGFLLKNIHSLSRRMALSGHEFNTRTLPAWAAHSNGIKKMGRSMRRAAALADVAIAEPLNDTVEMAGLEPLRMDDLIRLAGLS